MRTDRVFVSIRSEQFDILFQHLLGVPVNWQAERIPLEPDPDYAGEGKQPACDSFYCSAEPSRVEGYSTDSEGCPFFILFALEIGCNDHE